MNQTKVVYDFFEQVYNCKNTDFILEHFAQNYFEHTEHGARSNVAATEIVKGAFQIFPDLSVKVEDIVSTNEHVAVRLTFNGTHSGEFLGLKPTYKQIEWEAMEFFIVKDNIITESYGAWPLWDIHEKLTR